jgi:hypothetical protein
MIRPSVFPKTSRKALSIPLQLAALATILCLGASAHATNLVADPGFESAGGGNGYYPLQDNIYYAGQSIDANSWFVGTGDVYIDNQDPYVFDGNNSANLTGVNVYATNSLYQDLATVVGQQYLVSFWANSDAPNTFSLTENGLAVSGIPGSIVDNGFPSPDWLGNSSLFVEYSGEFVATSTTTDLEFTAYANPSYDNYINGAGSVVFDDASVTPTPEPGTIVLLLTGILGLGLLIARKRLGQSLSSCSTALA